jgi:hypothetical protein
LEEKEIFWKKEELEGGKFPRPGKFNFYLFEIKMREKKEKNGYFNPRPGGGGSNPLRPRAGK